MKRSSITTATMILAMAAAASPAWSADGPVPALPWLHEGLLLTYAWNAALSVGNEGRRPSQSARQGTSGSGWTQITVACIDNGKVVLAISSFANAGALGNNQPAPQGGSSMVGSVSDPGDYWMDPNKLATLRSMQNMIVTRAPRRAGDHTIDSVSVQFVKDGNDSEHVYDAKTGLCLHFATTVGGHVGGGDSGQGDTTMTRNDFINARELSVPWAQEAVPGWVQGVRTLRYGGPIISRGSLPSGGGLLVDIEISARGRGWVQGEITSGIQMRGVPPQKSEYACGRNQFAGLWAGPAALANLRNGQVLDEDPITKMRTAVTKADDRSVAIDSRNAAGETYSEYDRRTGMLIASFSYDALTKQQRTLRLQGQE